VRTICAIPETAQKVRSIELADDFVPGTILNQVRRANSEIGGRDPADVGIQRAAMRAVCEMTLQVFKLCLVYFTDRGEHA
jgi:hypothetical protein